MRMSRQERIEMHEKMEKLLPGIRRDLQGRFSEITSVDIGLKEAHGELSHTFSWRIFVKEKKRQEDLNSGQLLPREIMGHPTDVQQFQFELLEDDYQKYSPLWGGIQITGNGTGTLSCFVTDNADASGRIHILSNHHVLMGDFGASASGSVGQAGGACRSWCCTCGNLIATIVRGTIGNPANPAAPANVIDAAIAVLENESLGDPGTAFYTNKIVGIGPVFGSGVPMVDDVVRKRGRTTLLTVGRISSITKTANVVKRVNGVVVSTTTYTGNQLDLRPTHGSADWSRGGDSGSAIVNNLNQVVGLHFAGGKNSPFGTGNIIQNVTNGLNITILSSGSPETIPISGWGADPWFGEQSPLLAPTRDNLFGQLTEVLKARPGGDILLDIARQNSSEVLDLINDNREVGAAWNRFQGPEFIGHMVKNSKNPLHKIPSEIQGYNLQNLLIKMNDVLERHGSRQLSAAMEDHFSQVYNFSKDFQQADSLEELIAKGKACPECGTTNKGGNHGG